MFPVLLHPDLYRRLRKSNRSLRARLRKTLLRLRDGLWGGDYAYEALNLVDGRRTVGQIRDALAAIYGPVPVSEVIDGIERSRNRSDAVRDIAVADEREAT